MGTIAVTIRGSSLPGADCPPHVGVEVGIQIGKEVCDVFPGDSPTATWRLTLDRKPDGDWRGKAVHGPRGERFLYLVWRESTAAGPQMFRRAKLRLDAIPDDVARRADETGTLEATLGLTDRCAMPLCASIRPPVIQWTA